MKSNADIQLVGQTLLELGFKDYARYMFRVLHDTPFIVEDMHEDLFTCFDDVFNVESKRQNINICPRSGKTTLACLFLSYCWAYNDKMNFIYTSYSQSLLGEIARGLIDILESPIYKAMFPSGGIIEGSEEYNPVSAFWGEYLQAQNTPQTKEARYSAKKITSAGGGVILFSSVGASITGYGAGIRGTKGFSGALIIDDANKPADVHSQVMRTKVKTYYDETLLSRLNNSDTAVINIQQRLHVEDLTGYLNETYKFKTLSKPLIIDGVCQLPRQYTEERISELKQNEYMFQAQFMQNPYRVGGDIFKEEYWKYWEILPKIKHASVYADTAQKTKTHNDYSVLQLWGMGEDEKLYLIDQVRGKWEAPELEQQAVMFWNKHKPSYNLRSMCIEDKSSGTGLIQSLKRKARIPVKELKADRDKYTRAMDVLPYISSGYVYLPANAPFMSEYVAEFSQFTADDSHKHDDQVDPTCYAIADMKINPNEVKVLKRRPF